MVDPVSKTVAQPHPNGAHPWSCFQLPRPVTEFAVEFLIKIIKFLLITSVIVAVVIVVSSLELC